MNAVERLWRALGTHDWDAIRAQLHSQATIEFPHTGEVLTAQEYAALCRARRGSWAIEVHAVVSASEDLPVAVHASAATDEGRFRCGAFYTLHQARVAHGVELWVAEHAAARAEPSGGHHRH